MKSKTEKIQVEFTTTQLEELVRRANRKNCTVEEYIAKVTWGRIKTLMDWAAKPKKPGPAQEVKPKPKPTQEVKPKKPKPEKQAKLPKMALLDGPSVAVNKAKIIAEKAGVPYQQILSEAGRDPDGRLP